MTEIRQIHLEVVYRASTTCSSRQSLRSFVSGTEDEFEQAILELGEGIDALLATGTELTHARTLARRLSEQPENSMVAECLRRLIAEKCL